MSDYRHESRSTDNHARGLPMRMLAIVLIVVGSTLLLAWIVGRICSDRWTWSQWLLWLPSLTLVPGFLLLALGGWLLSLRRYAIITLCIASTLGPVGELTALWRPGELPTTTAASLRILHWTAGPQMRSTALLLNAIERAQPDVIVVLGARRAAGGESLAQWGVVPGPMPRGEFMIFSRIPVVSCRSLARSDDIQLVQLVVQPSGAEAVECLLLDLPSDPARNRWAIAQATSALIGRTLRSTPSIVLGDLNMTQDSRAMRSILPGWSTAWPAGGRGWGGTWPRSVPLWRIDHVLVPPGDPVPRVTTFDPGAGRHRAQVIDLALQPVPG